MLRLKKISDQCSRFHIDKLKRANQIHSKQKFKNIKEDPNWKQRMGKINETLQKTNKIDKTLARFILKEKTKITMLWIRGYYIFYRY